MEISYHYITDKVVQEMSQAKSLQAEHNPMRSNCSEDASLPPPAAFFIPLSTDLHSETLAGPHKHEAVKTLASCSPRKTAKSTQILEERGRKNLSWPRVLNLEHLTKKTAQPIDTDSVHRPRLG